MKKLDENKVTDFINKYKNKLKEVSAGLYEDWFWTGATIWNNVDNNINFESAFTGSDWATPCIIITTIDDKSFTFSCYEGESKSDKPSFFSYGVISQEVADNMDPLIPIENAETVLV